MTTAAVTGAAPGDAPGGSYLFNQDWLFGGKYTSGSEHPGFDDSGFTPVTVPHTVVPLSWGNWDSKSWEKVWIYRKHFDGGAVGVAPAGAPASAPPASAPPASAGSGGPEGPAVRVLADFDGVMVNGTAVLNGTTVGSHAGGYLPALYQRTRALAYRLDGSRQTAGATHIYSRAGWAQDVFGYDDYGSSGGDAALKPPLPGVPYLVSESVGSLAGAPRYRWTDPPAVLATQARMHAQVHHTARAGTGYAGLLGWCATDYQSRNGGNRLWRALKWGGVLDTFRVPKFAAGLYASQADPGVRPVIAPAFCWDFGPGSPTGGPGAGAMIATNCDRLDLYVGGRLVTTATPDRARYGGLAHPPVFADLTVDGAGLPELRIAGYVGGREVASLSMSADRSGDRLAMTADHAAIDADGSDATRITFRAVDAYGNQRPRASGEVTLSLLGPARLVGDNPFDFGGYGGVGGAFVRSLPGPAGLVTVTAWHATLGRAGVRVRVAPVPVRLR